jgi:hypothetical protein
MSDRALKKHIILKVNGIADHNSLVQLETFLDKIEVKSNKKEIFSFKGSITKEEGEDMQRVINEEFGKIEGEW